ncbi:helicase [Microbacterium sp. cf332]|uniref:helicase n=1 Tax=Microbacterium sp. cf332 TaxID=1761804 RepID=UPI000892130F|nr:helicase [Microbacterium sp. cf332]SDQ84614.1 hypothetical protein SAMN04487847_2720 [Microbacterium sp. cf332]
MAGVATAFGVLAVTMTIGVGCAAAGAAAIRSAQVTATADTAALAAADTALGFVGGVPCERAAEVVAAAGLELAACDVDGAIATVEVGASTGVFRVHARARAGPAS